MVVIPGPSTFTEAQLCELWDEGSNNAESFRSRYPQNQSKNCYCHDFRMTSKREIRSERKRRRRIDNLLNRWIQWAADSESFFRRIDGEFSNLFAVNYQRWGWVGDSWTLIRQSPDVERASVVEKASRLLQRLPSTPPKIDLSYGFLGKPFETSNLSKYFNQVEHLSAPQIVDLDASSWTKLQIVTKFSTASLRITLLLIVAGDSRFDIGFEIRNFLDLISELTAFLDRYQERKLNQAQLLEINVVRVYLWTVWNRILLLLFWYVLGEQLKGGYDEQWDHMLAIRGMPLLMHSSIRSTARGWNHESSPYMCPWAFELLKTSRGSIGLDFRDFHQRFGEFHGDKPQRCNFEGDLPCNGANPLDCGRFRDQRLVLKEQSQHHGHEGDCEKLTWNESSYLSVSGPTAVALPLESGRVQYMKASERTMAISHVWSHGRGGRPHDGMNRCLHDQIVLLAELNQCDSYWIDTLCIPEEHNERKIAIGHINRIFAGSKIIVVLDRDLMDIDVSNLNLKVLESLLATFLVCDWNVRAWTMLEALKGCHSLYILCKNYRLLSLRRAIADLWQHGSIAISNLFLASQHLLPASLMANDRINGIRSLEHAASLLSHRHATRPDDDIVIWSLISQRPACFNAKDFWQGRINRRVKTAFLMSSSPRLIGVRGFSWAPATPYIRHDGHEDPHDLVGPYLVFDGTGSEDGLVTRNGLQADWLIYRVDPRDDHRYGDAPTTTTSFTPDGRKESRVLGDHRIVNRCWQFALSFVENHISVLLVQPKGLRSDLIYRASSDRGESHGQVFAICTSKDDIAWKWMGVRSWPLSIDPPEMVQEELLII